MRHADEPDLAGPRRWLPPGGDSGRRPAAGRPAPAVIGFVRAGGDRLRQPLVQGEPFSPYVLGAPALPVCVAWKPRLTDPPGGRLAL
ncbi:hypothetical protein FHX34_10836 [Actinoplanes teichomyceticus]|uniref:Uncharacterized protein n=1 Tax=Actinoplanes teichomyceticus TaxID=1867 RepID=A0A561VCH6_ACTTI|nr:hypothetical protein FHX34_10836 [Actinoplanes teichomyceticus]